MATAYGLLNKKIELRTTTENTLKTEKLKA